eukprot:CAMPEP_0174250046 /NCGR_PEP_ID=MMETSP0439-20130205/343_1 /TAXON_ID=0 /ORGANISM="Stereomyxa ramosa, Strain Chinc5" /LENGTH=552 /DNA_ID=CAMNT_0015330019 /DNA_START=350 /DNA_END=2005 /DNA_ORIENTATION=-
MLAAACDDSKVTLFNLSEGLVYINSCQKVKGRMLSIAWHPTKDEVVTGDSGGSIRKWDVKSARSYSRITVEKTKQGKKAKVWAVAVLGDGTIVSGDSDGNTQFWDENTDTLIAGFKSHSADVIAITSYEDAVYSSGVDGKICMFRSTEISGTNLEKWNYVCFKRVHSHDVYSLDILHRNNEKKTKRVISGGLDCMLADYPLHLDQEGVTHSPFPQRHVVSFCEEKGLLLFQLQKKLQIWKIESNSEVDVSMLHDAAVLGVAEPPVLLLELQTKENVVCSTISKDGSLLAFSDTKKLQVFKLIYTSGNSNPAMQKVNEEVEIEIETVGPKKGLPAARHILFTPDSSCIILSTQKSLIRVLLLPTFELLGKFSQHQGDALNNIPPSPITFLSLSSDARWLASADLTNTIHVFDLDSFKHHCTLPRFDSPYTAIEFHCLQATLVVVCASNQFYLWNVAENQLEDWSREYGAHLPKRFTKLKEKLFGISFNRHHPACMAIYNSECIVFIDLQKGLGTKKNKINFKVVRRFGPILFMGFMSSDDLVVVERPWADICL